LQKDSEAYFRGLDLVKEYYPMVASQSAKAFYAPPPKALRPNQPKSDSTNTNGRYISSSRAARPAHVEEHDSGMDMHGASSSGEDNMNIDLSRMSPYPQGSGNRTIPMLRVPYNASTGTPNHLDTEGGQFSDMPNQASQKASVRAHTDAEAASRIQSEQLNAVRDKFRPAVRDEQGRGIPVDLGSGNRDSPENAREHRDPRAAASPIHPEVQQMREAPRSTEEGRPSHQAQTQESYPGHGGKQARPRAGASGSASQNQFPEDREKETRDLHQRIEQLQAENQQLQAENRKLHTDLAESIQNSTDIQNKYNGLKAELIAAQQRCTAGSRQGYVAALQSVRDDLDKHLANLPWNNRQVPNMMAGTSKPVEPQRNASSSAGLKREIVRDGGAAAAGGESGGERAAKRLRVKAGGVDLTGDGETSCQ
jgi:hypothetical protein